MLPSGTSAARTIAEGAVMAALTVVLALVVFYVPLLGTVLTFFLPAPVALVTARRGIGAALASIVAAGVILALFLGPVQALGLVTLFAFMGLALGFGVGRGWPGGQTIALGGVAVLLVVAASVAISALFFHQNIVSLTVDAFQASIDSIASSSLPGADRYAAFVNSLIEMVRTYPLMLVAPGALAVLTLSAIWYASLRPLFRRAGGIEVPRLTSFAAWRVPYAVAWVWFGSMLLVFLQTVPSLAWAGTAGQYLYLAFVYVFTVIGASVAYFICRYFRMSVAVSGALAILFALTPPWTTLLLFAGLFETLFGLRARLLPRLAADHALRDELAPEAWASLEASLRPFMGPPPPKTPRKPEARAEKRPAARPGRVDPHAADPSRGPGGGKRKVRQRGSGRGAPQTGAARPTAKSGSAPGRAGRAAGGPAAPAKRPASGRARGAMPKSGPPRDARGRVIRGRLRRRSTDGEAVRDARRGSRT